MCLQLIIFPSKILELSNCSGRDVNSNSHILFTVALVCTKCYTYFNIYVKIIEFSSSIPIISLITVKMINLLPKLSSVQIYYEHFLEKTCLCSKPKCSKK